MKVLVLLKEGERKKQVITKSKEIICPICQEPCELKMENYK